MPTLTGFGTTRAERDAWILQQRPTRSVVDPLKPNGFFLEHEPSATGSIVSIATVLLTNRECPWRCLMCDLWKNTLSESVAEGMIPAQIDYALARLAPAAQIKLYNSGSFFDRRAIPFADWPAIAARLRCFERIVVESHPLLAHESVRFRDLLDGPRLEVAMGLETVHAPTLAQLNKGMTLDQFSKAANILREHEVDLRVFILVQPPFMPEHDALHWAQRSLHFAFDAGATAATLIPTRGGNGVMEILAEQNLFSPPSLATVEAALEYGLRLQRGRVFVDLWNLEQGVAAQPCCLPLRRARLEAMNLQQMILPPVSCHHCGDL